MYVKVRYRANNDDAREAEISSIHESGEQAAQVVKQDATQETTQDTAMFEWPNTHPPQVGETVEVVKGQINAYRRHPLIEMLLDRIVKRPEMDHLHRQNEALGQENVQLHDRVKDLEKQKGFHAQHYRENNNRQIRDLWISGSQQTARENLMGDYVRAEMPVLAGRVIFAPDADTVAHLNRIAQENRIHEHRMEGCYGIAHNHILLHKGDRVQFFRNEEEELHVRDGDLGEIIHICRDQRTVAVALDRSEMQPCHLVFVPLREYSDLELGYAATYERAASLDVYKAFILATPNVAASELVDSLSAFHVQIYADSFTARTQFPLLADEPHMDQGIDLDADPLGPYLQKD